MRFGRLRNPEMEWKPVFPEAGSVFFYLVFFFFSFLFFLSFFPCLFLSQSRSLSLFLSFIFLHVCLEARR